MTGEDNFYYTMLALGGDGGMLASAHLQTADFAAIHERMQANDHRGARAIWSRLETLVSLLFREANPMPIKYCLWRQGLIRSPECRLPLTRVSAELAAELDKALRACAAIAAWMSALLSLSACSGDVHFPLFIPILMPAPPPAPLPPQPGAPPPQPRAEPATPDRVRVYIARWFHAAGYEDFQVSALVEHARIESGFNPCIRGRGGFGYTFQWGWTRLQQLQQFAGTPGCPPLDKQLAFADKELRNEPKFACFWRATTNTAALTALRRGFGGGSC
jgi:hypothetical protein